MARIDLNSAGVKLFYAEEVEANVRPIDAENYHHIEGVKELPEMNASPETLDSTTLDDEVFKASILGLHDLSGVLGFTFNFTQKFRDDWQALYDLYVSLKEDNLGMWFAIQIPGVEKSLYFRGKPLHSNFNGISTNSVLEVSAYIMAESEPLWEDAPYTYTTILGQPTDQEPIYLYFLSFGSGKMFIDWDDGSPIEEFDSNYDVENSEGYFEVEHTFPSLAERTIKIRSTFQWSPQYNGISPLDPLEIRTDKMFQFVKEGAFAGCYNLHTVVFADETLELGGYLFEEDENIVSIHIPKNVSVLLGDTFANAYYLDEITVDQKNKYFTSVDGILYSKDKTKLIACPQYKEFEDTIFYIPETVQTIGASAFKNYNFEEISVHLPVNIKKIEESAFSYSLISVPSNLYNVQYIGAAAFERCLLGGYLEIPKSVLFIGQSAFSGTTLSEVDLLCELEKLPEFMFQGVQTLDWVSLPDTIKVLGYGCFMDTSIDSNGLFELPPLLEVVEEYAFQNTRLQEFIAPQTLKTIKSGAFIRCASLQTVVLNEGLEYLGQNVFRETAITNLIIPDSVQFIGAGIFARCKYLQEVTSPFIGQERTKESGRESVVSHWVDMDFDSSDGMISKTTYYDSSGSMQPATRFFPASLTKLTITEPSKVRIGLCSGFPGDIEVDLLFGSSTKGLFASSGVKSVTIPNGISSIGAYAFYFCEALETIIIPSSITVLEIQAFYQCSSLIEISLPNVLAIGNQAFHRSGIESVYLGNSLQTLGTYVFAESKITNIFIPDSVISIDSNMLTGCQLLETISVPFLGKTAISEDLNNYRYKSLIWYFASSVFPNSYQVEALVSSGTVSNYRLPLSLTNIVVRNENVIGTAAFRKVTSLQSIIYNQPVIEVKMAALSYLTGANESLLTILSSNTLVKIGSGAFAQCQFVTDLYLKNNILEIGPSAFSNGANPYRIECQAASKPVGWDVEWDVSSPFPLTLHDVSWGVNY